jgi:hypothetical protein
MFSLGKNLEQEQEIHTPDQTKCFECERIFSTKSSLIRHKRHCQGVRPTVCPKCLKEFSNRNTRNKHISRGNCQSVDKIVPGHSWPVHESSEVPNTAGLYICLNYGEDVLNSFKVGRAVNLSKRLKNYQRNNKDARFVYIHPVDESILNKAESGVLRTLRSMFSMKNLLGPGQGRSEAFRGNIRDAVAAIKLVLLQDTKNS